MKNEHIFKLMQDHPNSILMSEDTNIRKRLVFSRHFYEGTPIPVEIPLQEIEQHLIEALKFKDQTVKEDDIDGVDDEDDITQSMKGLNMDDIEVEEDEDEEEETVQEVVVGLEEHQVMNLCDAWKNHIYEWLTAEICQNHDGLFFTYDYLDYLRSREENSLFILNKDSVPKCHIQVGDNVVVTILDIHFEAIKEMLSILQQPNSFGTIIDDKSAEDKQSNVRGTIDEHMDG